MKKLFITAFICAIASIQYGYAQDKIVKLTGENISCTVTEITDQYIKFRTSSEGLIKNIKKGKIESISFASGELKKINSRTVINGEEDWKKVQIVNSISDVEGYKKGELLNTEASIKWSSSNLERSKNMAIADLKKVAASKGYHIVYVTDTKVKTSGGVAPNTKRSKVRASISALGYSYN